MFGNFVPVRADVANIRSFSVHADHAELLAWLGAATRPPDTTLVVHGESTGSEQLRAAIESDLGWPAMVPAHLRPCPPGLIAR